MFLTFKGEWARWKLCIINYILIFGFSTTNFFLLPWFFNTPSKPKTWQALLTFSNISKYVYIQGHLQLPRDTNAVKLSTQRGVFQVTHWTLQNTQGYYWHRSNLCSSHIIVFLPLLCTHDFALRNLGDLENFYIS